MSATTIMDSYREAESTFIAENPKSKAVYDRATNSLPGGNTRSSLFYDPFPVAIAKGEDAYLYDVDGHKYTDLLGEYTAGLYGHSHPAIIDAVVQATKRGLSYGGQHEDEAKLAELLKQRFPSIDLLRFTNSGTEATLMALAAAKAFTGKKKIIVFAGAYHGGVFSFAGGVSGPVNAPHEYVILRYNDLNSMREALQDPVVASDLAAILVEPMVGSGGAIPATDSFLEGLRKLATECGAVLIFDEVMTSRMHGGGGIQSRLAAAARPDLTTLGKYIGGGMSFGAFGGKRAIMAQFDPRTAGALVHAGTFNNNVFTMSAGRTGLEQIFTPERARTLHAQGETLRVKLQQVCAGTLMKVTGYGSLLCFHFTRTALEELRSPLDVGLEYKAVGDLLHLFLLGRGYYIARRGFIALSLALSERDLDGFVDVVEDFVRTYASILRVPEAQARL